ncbi:bifunctional tRNA (5-methylaminomethyl-2-thiouridine)(34)-methyltransferase MnmD/FAD-dependent 5-carboxymethylaminomethyl-2-thiouridine(34) oxidoreductase MnmC [Parahalioglobus pacificus]|uniref:bifunctional tRNA (5-methylaminomethyl-2-thiouridine)(34)-methyltransferase MnmD/FAD-dependent 5-carboxymethylaminomethyl-2-thiouridine(34) oxidoreductase MnmC n=1 Tax=Parahalioglobus pacificus TaxID=930806 RepID=UPI00167C381E|nr:bifunctional tRNA (5-methylaminomethyl-2-thiouridine)(34)-methyltransferase MnmD/FAD-dependent 5-carboxymethylaminomethyl-2-thiouridine(34) oxidoreductase MnmC [Halioglobus pacificus]
MPSTTVIQRDNQPWAPAATADINWSASEEPRAQQYDDVYYQRGQGLDESLYTFLEGNRIAERLGASPEQFAIAETGFGTGLNFLLTWAAWRAIPQPRPRLHFVSIERHPLVHADAAKALSHWQALTPLSEQLLSAWPPALRGQHRLSFEESAVTLDIWVEDASAALADMASFDRPWIDAWYLDGFAPAKNPDMWQPDLFRSVAALSRRGATVATFTAAGSVRRGLAEAGFNVEKVAGFGHKRDSLRAVLAPPGATSGEDSASQPTPPGTPRATTKGITPWDISQQPEPGIRTAIVIGAGLAGASTAAALARRGINVTVLEEHTVASAASGNAQGVIYTRLSRKHSALTDFALQSYTFAIAQYRRLFGAGALKAGEDGQLCGYFQQSTATEDMAYLTDKLAGTHRLASVVSAEAASELLGIEQPMAGYWFPDSGWLHPPAVCEAMLSGAGITVKSGCGQVTASAGNVRRWQVETGDKRIFEADALVLCGGVSTNQFAQAAWLPLQPIRGQTTQLPAADQTRSLRSVMCHEGYISPPRHGQHCIGASFAPGNTDTTVTRDDHEYNLATLAKALPGLSQSLNQLDTASLGGRAALRCASPDYLPVAGPLPDRTAFLETYAGLRDNAKLVQTDKAPVIPGLFVNTAHGSRGLTSTPLCGELIASQLCGEPLPLGRHFHRNLAPARFLVRDLKRNRC